MCTLIGAGCFALGVAATWWYAKRRLPHMLRNRSVDAAVRDLDATSTALQGAVDRANTSPPTTKE